MQKFFHKIRAVMIVIGLLLVVAASSLSVSAQSLEVYVGGMPAGFTMGLGGAQIVGVCEILTEEGVSCPAKEAQLNVGDIILTYGGVRIDSAADIDRALSANGGKDAEICVRRDEEQFSIKITPVKDLSCGKYKLGVLIRDSVSGIGTVTYIEKGSRRFGSLGHAVSDERGEKLALQKGTIYACSIVNVIRGERGRAGELKGLFINERGIASADRNCETGIYGNFTNEYDLSKRPLVETSTNAVPGKAVIYSTIDGTEPKEYAVSIVKVDTINSKNKNFVLKVTDEALLKSTGGIVQGMSGSPILQNGKLIGAVTLVFLNDPSRGYGISISNMLGN